MKKFLSLILCVIMLLCSILPVAAADNSETEMNCIQLSAKRISGKLNCEAPEETARKILLQLGMPKSSVLKVDEETLRQVYDATYIGCNTVYAKIDEYGNETHLTQESCINAVEKIKADSPGTSASNEDTDSYFYKSITLIETKNSPKGTIGILCGFQWLTNPVYRARDALVLSCGSLAFHYESASMYFYTTEETRFNGQVQTREISEFYDYNQLNAQGKLVHYDHLLAFTYNLPNDIHTTETQTDYNNMSFLVTASSIIVNPQIATNLVVTASYFHQFIFFDAGISFSGEGASVSISPSYKYWQPKQIGQAYSYVP